MPKKNGFMMFVTSRLRETKLKLSIPNAITKFAPEWENMGPAQREPFIQEANRANAKRTGTTATVPLNKVSTNSKFAEGRSRSTGIDPGQGAVAGAYAHDVVYEDDWADWGAGSGAGQPQPGPSKAPGESDAASAAAIPLPTRVVTYDDYEYDYSDGEEEFFTPGEEPTGTTAN